MNTIEIFHKVTDENGKTKTFRLIFTNQELIKNNLNEIMNPLHFWWEVIGKEDDAFEYETDTGFDDHNQWISEFISIYLNGKLMSQGYVA